MTSSLRSATAGIWSRTPSNSWAASSCSPLRVTDSTDSAMRSMNVAAPGSGLVKLTVVRVRKVFSEVVRSSSTS